MKDLEIIRSFLKEDYTKFIFQEFFIEGDGDHVKGTLLHHIEILDRYIDANDSMGFRNNLIYLALSYFPEMHEMYPDWFH